MARGKTILRFRLSDDLSITKIRNNIGNVLQTPTSTESHNLQVQVELPSCPRIIVLKKLQRLI
ncbi:unnamed protein product [Fusarium graminearum]|nr:unnamed protein product [Fusarium graminearum]